ncbi:putative rnase H family protein isoform X2 [Zea mays]|nr:putative rnase H family protein isoform X2 [Zea mays]XP_008676866.1 putative rnase H family protein isoform X2 [Zea mays]|eukprot:XP_008676863.1 putative rnase H family protein isoform X3 [Zea mays]
MDSSSVGEPFYVVRKGDVIGIYKTLSECQAQVSNSVRDPSVTVFKGYSLRKDTEEYLAARGLRNALYAIDATDARDELFDDLVPCPFQQPDGAASSTLKRSQEIEIGPSKKHPKVDEQVPLPDSHLSCILEFDGASKGNPGKAGAGAIIRQVDGSVVCSQLIAQLREGLGIATNNAAEYRALILGLTYAAKKGFKYIRAQGDSKLVCNQVQDIWRVKNDNMASFCKKVKELKGTFHLFQIRHVLREYNSAADAQANFAVELPVGEVQEQSNFPC